MAVAFTALLVALGGTSYAAVKLSANSVQTKHIKNNAVTGAKVKGNTLTGSDINEATLAGIKSAEAQHALSAAGIDKAIIVTKTEALAVAPQVQCPGTPPNSCFLPVTQFNTATALCPANHTAIAGGGRPDDYNNNTIVESYPTGGSGWAASAGNDDVTRPRGFTAFAICVPGTSQTQ
jgi:hypothetical protein